MPFAGSDREALSAVLKRWLEPMLQLAGAPLHSSKLNLQPRVKRQED